jgi:hypothetical protein
VHEEMDRLWKCGGSKQGRKKFESSFEARKTSVVMENRLLRNVRKNKFKTEMKAARNQIDMANNT